MANRGSHASQGSLRWASVGGDLHEVGHNGDPNNRGQIPSAGLLHWHISRYTYLIDKLRSTPDASGNMLDAIWHVWLQLSPWLLSGAVAAGAAGTSDLEAVVRAAGYAVK